MDPKGRGERRRRFTSLRLQRECGRRAIARVARRFDALPVGGTADVQLNGTLTIAGQSNPLVADLRIVKLSRNALLVGTRVPIIVSLKEYGLQDGVDALRNVMNLNVLSGSALVTFSVVLRADR
ncbi:hypothetical protein GCT13_22855 [Paraburkholderia sp. CNPSo 3157]|uniref:Lipid/polyisoprenoid-binding YceI-like domain-containing protein n=1 Tax=Paraburkholderia franconis TaxID=2654983 RepID=A0A7X1THT4_9BURK|nr:YceI family protein [Paraburkholderia franconis]MPW19661.1 hypothetical protein [Paraburkholderia franconis]